MRKSVVLAIFSITATDSFTARWDGGKDTSHYGAS